MNWKVAGMAGTALLTMVLSGAGAVAGANKFTGTISLGAAQTFQDDVWGPGASFDESFASLSGEGKLNVAFTQNINLQIDVNAVASFADGFGGDLDRDAGVQTAAHLYYRTNSYAVGVAGGVGVIGGVSYTPDYYFVGVEGQYYLDNITVGLNAGILDSSSDDVGGSDDLYLNDAWYAGAEVRYYLNDKTTLSANAGYISGEFVFGNFDFETIHWGVKAEYRPEPKEPLSLWVAYEGRTTNADEVAGPGDYDKETHTVKVGVTFTFGVDGSKAEQDRTGPAFNQMDYGALVVGG